MAALELAAQRAGPTVFAVTSVFVAVAVMVALYFVAGHHREHARRVLAVAVPFGAALGFTPPLLMMTLPRMMPALAGDGAVLLVYAFVGALLSGLFLTTLAITGLEHQQAFSVLGHPGFKHFVRLCIHPDGTIEGWCIGKDDPLAPEPPKLVDAFRWS